MVLTPAAGDPSREPNDHTVVNEVGQGSSFPVIFGHAYVGQSPEAVTAAAVKRKASLKIEQPFSAQFRSSGTQSSVLI